MKISKESGISIIEITISLGILSIISTASVWLVFTSLSLRDQALATIQTNEAIRVFSHTLRRAIQTASVISGSATTLLITSPTECTSFAYDQAARNVRYSKITSTGCAPDPNPTNLFFPTVTKINSATFTVSALPTGGRQVNVTGTVQTILPFNNYLTSFTETYINLVD